MRRISRIILLAVCFVPGVSYADCSGNGYTVAYINGVSDSKMQAAENRALLQETLPRQINNQSVTVHLAYNPNHIAGVGDIIQAISQMLFAPISGYDLHTALRQMAAEDTTRKLLLVGHSQGALYANSMYEYMTAHGEPARAVDVYAVATPASYVAGGGKYINSNEDAVIYASRLVAEKVGAPTPLPSNVDIVGSLGLLDLPATHMFSTYISGAGDEMAASIQSQLAELKSDSSSGAGPCFTPPPPTFGDVAERMVFAAVDPLAEAAKTKLVTTVQVAAAVTSAAVALAQSTYQLIFSASEIASNSSLNPAAPQNAEKNFEVTKKLYGSSIDKTEYQELNNNQGASVATAFETTPAPVELAQSASTTIATSTSPATTTPSLPSVISGGSALPPPLISEETNTDVATSTPEPQDEATSTSTLPLDLSSATTSATTTLSVVEDQATSTPTSTPARSEQVVLSDTFDTFNGAAWQTFGSDVRSFDFESADSGECFLGGCIVGMGDNVYDTNIPRIYTQMPTALLEGAFVVHAKVRSGFNRPTGAITACRSDTVSCLDVSGSYVEGINFFFFTVTNDDEWHTYYLGWRQGDTSVQRCTMVDDTNRGDCVWSDMFWYPRGTSFSGVALWSNNGYRADVGPPHANLWFDELEAASVQ